MSFPLHKWASMMCMLNVHRMQKINLPLLSRKAGPTLSRDYRRAPVKKKKKNEKNEKENLFWSNRDPCFLHHLHWLLALKLLTACPSTSFTTCLLLPTLNFQKPRSLFIIPLDSKDGSTPFGLVGDAPKRPSPAVPQRLTKLCKLGIIPMKAFNTGALLVFLSAR